MPDTESTQHADYASIGRDKRASGVSEDDLVAAASQPVPSAEYRRLWKHQMGDTYVLITANVVGNPERGFEIEHYLGTGVFDTLGQAKRVGLRQLDRSDDFNIGAIRYGRLAAILWMGEIVDDEPEVVDRIAAELRLPHNDGSEGDQ